MAGIEAVGGGLPGAIQRAYDVPQVQPGQSGFAERLGQLLGEVDRLQDHARDVTTKMISGEVTDVHEVMIAQQEAGVAFTLMLEIRNRLLESYQEIMRMQV